MGVCGKDSTTAALQDLLVHAAKGIAMYAHRASQLGSRDREVDVFVAEALFSTVTNVNFDPARLETLLVGAGAIRERARALYEEACRRSGKTSESLGGPAARQPAATRDGDQGLEVGVDRRRSVLGEETAALQELITYGLKGAASYLDHAQILGEEDSAAFALLHAGLDFLARDKPTQEELVGWALRAGELNLKAMELLDAANTGAYGHPSPTSVRVTAIKGKAIAVSGHDLKDLHDLLNQTEGKDINVYTHGEMLPAHGYPGLKSFRHLVGNYGGAWQDQQREFGAFPGAILMTTNCIQKPRDSYNDRIFTSGLVAWPGVRHIADGNFAPVIESALAQPGFGKDEPEKTIMVGFARHAVLSAADKIVEAVKSGKIRHFFLIGGCDGARPGRNSYTEFAQKVPEDCLILTLACGKYRFNKLDFGSIDGIPRLLDVGQCNDAYSAIQIALALAGAFNCGVNELPLSLVLSWYEQKAVAILLTLLHLGVKNIRIGPTLPAFVTPSMLEVLKSQFNLMPVSTPQDDLKAILG
jgi:hydroxylamine reductase